MIDPLRERARAHEPLRGDLRGLFSPPYQSIQFPRNRLYARLGEAGFQV